MGLNNWRRLKYPLALQEILAARDEISLHRSQALLEVAKVNNSLGALYLDMGRYQEAYEYLNSAYTAFADNLTFGSIETRAVQASIAQYHYLTGNFEGALREIQFILDHSDEVTEKVVVASSNHLRASVLSARGEYEEALDIYYSVLDLYNDFLEDGKLSEEFSRYQNDPNLDTHTIGYHTTSLRWIVRTYNHIGEMYIRLGRFENADIAFTTALDICLGNIRIGRENLTAAQVYTNIAILYARNGNLQDAIRNIETSIAIQRRLFGYEDTYPGLVEAYRVHGDILVAQGKPDEALELYVKAIRLAVDGFDENHPKTAAAYSSLGYFHFGQSEYEYAIINFERGIDIRTSILGFDHPDTVFMLIHLSKAYENTGDQTRANDAAIRAIDICERIEISGDLSSQANALLRRSG